MSAMNYAELAEAYMDRGDLIDALNEEQERMASAIDGMEIEIEIRNATIERIRAALDECRGQSSQVDNLIDDIDDAIEGNDGH